MKAIEYAIACDELAADLKAGIISQAEHDRLLYEVWLRLKSR